MTQTGPAHAVDLGVVRRAGRIVAVQASVALTAVLILVGAVVAVVFTRAQQAQITEELTAVAMSADDTDDPPPGMELALRDNAGVVSYSDGGEMGVPLLSGPAGFTDLHDKGRHYRALVADRPEGRVAALVDLAPHRMSRARLFAALGLAELTGIIASIVVVVLFTRRSVRPLVQALALQRRFVADASHELRAPLSVLHTRAQLLSTRLKSGDVTTASRDAEAMVADTRALSSVVDDLLASATLTAAGHDGARIDLGAVSREVCASMSPYAESVGVRLACDVRHPGSLDVTGTETALRRALTALIDNAITHGQAAGTVDVVTRRDGQQVIVSVIDDGIGIDEATMATLFTRFSRGAADTNRTDRQSHGIGLALVREIVRAHGGEVTAASAPGRGANFTITLPAASTTVRN